MSDIFDYDNLINRPPGKYLRLGTKLSKGIRQVQHQIPVYAADWLQANAEAMKTDKPLWVVLGDSMAQGIGGSDYTRGWAGQLRDILHEHGRDYRMVNLSISGARVSDVLERQLPAMEALGVKPALVTMMIGSNNLARKSYRLQAPAEYTEVLKRLPKGSVVANLPGNGAMQLSIAHQLHQAAEAGKVIVANMRGGAMRDWRGKLASDHFHPNDLGYTSLAQSFAKAMRLKP